MKIQELLDRYESFKKKWLQLNDQDMFDRLTLQDDMEDKVIELKSKYLEEKLIYDRDRWLEMIRLKEIKDLDWKKKYTDTTAKAECDKLFFDKELELITMKASYEMLSNKASQVVEYVNVVKLSLRKDFSI